MVLITHCESESLSDPSSSDFPKSLWACTIAEIITFSIVGAIIYVYTGDQYMVTPAFGALEDLYKKVSPSLYILTLFVILFTH